MGMRFRRSISLGKGAHINLSKSGIGFSTGIKGMSVSTGKRGAYLNMGIPGTGISTRTKIGGSSSSHRSSGRSSSSGRAVSASSPATLSPEKQYALAILQSHQTNQQTDGRANIINISIDETDGSIQLRFPDTGEEITDPTVLKVAKSLPEYKNALPNIKAEQQRIWTEIQQRSSQETSGFVNIHRLAPEVFPYEKYCDDLRALSPLVYSRQVFPRPQPSQQEIESALWKQAETAVGSVFSKKKKIQQYWSDNYQSFWQFYMNQWLTEKEAFDNNENATEQAENEKFLNEYNVRKSWFEHALKNDKAVIENDIEAWLRDLELPAQVSAQIEYESGSKVLFVDLDLPEIEDIPSTTVSTLKSGETRVKDKSQKQLREDYARCVFGLGIFIAACTFNINANIVENVISGYTQRRDSSGDLQEEYIYSVKISRDSLVGIKIDSPEEFFLSCENRMKLSQAYIFKPIVPYDSSGQQ